MVHEKFSVFLENQNKRLRTLAIYMALVLLFFSLIVPSLGRVKEAKQEVALTETSMTEAVLPEAEEPVQPPEPTTVISQAQPTNKETESTKRTISAAAVAKVDPVDITKIIWPVKGKIIREFGLSYSLTFSDYRNHNGIDIEVKRNTEAVAVLPGKIACKDMSKGAATTLIIDHGNGWRSEYAHLEETLLKPGDVVAAGQAIGIIGQPGINEILEGPHLHYSLRKDGKAVNPATYLHE